MKHAHVSFTDTRDISATRSCIHICIITDKLQGLKLTLADLANVGENPLWRVTHIDTLANLAGYD